MKIHLHTRYARRLVTAAAAIVVLGPGAALARPVQASVAASGPTTQIVVNGASITLQPPTAALHANGEPSTGGAHGTGLLLPTGPVSPAHAAVRSATTVSGMAVGSMTSLPSSVDLTQYNPPVGNQGGVNSCVAWATGYYLRGWYAKRDGYYPTGGSGGTGSFAPMYTYTQIVKGSNSGTSFPDNLQIQQNQGIDTRTDYAQGDYDYTTQPTTVEQASASRYKIASYRLLVYMSGQGTATQQAIETSLAGGDPVALSLPAYDNIESANAANYYIDGVSGTFVSAQKSWGQAARRDGNVRWRQ